MCSSWLGPVICSRTKQPHGPESVREVTTPGHGHWKALFIGATTINYHRNKIENSNYILTVFF